MPSQEFLLNRFSYDEDTGILVYKTDIKYTKIKAGDVAGSLSGTGYLKVIINKRTYAIHRVIWKMMTGEEPTNSIDHKDRNKTNNRWSNLRLASKREQEANKCFTGVSKAGCGSTYQARIYHQGKRIHIGQFKTQSEAQSAYRVKCKELRGEFAPY